MSSPSITGMLADAFEWLRYERKCYILSHERGPWAHHRPDAIGVTHERKCIEIEIKRSLSDFKVDNEKRIWQQRELFRKAWPSQFYFFCPPSLIPGVLPLMQTGLGLLTWEEGQKTLGGNRPIVVVKAARKQPDAKKLTVHALLAMVRHQSGTYVAILSKAGKAGFNIYDRTAASPAPAAQLGIAATDPLLGGHDYTSADVDIMV